LQGRITVNYEEFVTMVLESRVWQANIVEVEQVELHYYRYIPRRYLPPNMLTSPFWGGVDTPRDYLYKVIGVLYLYDVLGVLSCFVFRSFFSSGDHFLEAPFVVLFKCFFSVIIVCNK
jgi:hypothetical protein